MEFLVIIGVMVVVAIVAYYSFTTSTIFPENVPQSMLQQQKLVKDGIIHISRHGANTALEWIEKQGGYVETEPANTVSFTKVSVPYWQKCNSADMAPSLSDIEEGLEDATEHYIRNSLYQKAQYFGKNVSFGVRDLSVDANILDSKIDFKVYLPTVLSGYSIEQPYTFSVPTNFKQIYEFGKNFIQENAQKRMLEHFTISTIYFSDKLATQGVLTECGESIYLSGPEIGEGLEQSIRYSISNIAWWEPMQKASDGSKSYSIESVMGKKYPQLDIGLYLPDSFSIESADSLSITNNDFVASAFIWTIPVCFAAYNWKYSVLYPVIVRVKDGLTGDYVNFAVMVDVDEMLPGNCIGPHPGSGDTGIDMDCFAGITVTDSSGSPLKHASANFGGYTIGKSDEYGVIRGPVVCGTEDLGIQMPGYSFYKERISSDSINGTYTLKRIPDIDIRMSSVMMKDYDGSATEPDNRTVGLQYKKCRIMPTTHTIMVNISRGEDSYLVSNVDPSSISSADCWQSASCTACSADHTDEDNCRQCANACSADVTRNVSVSYIPSGSYTIKADMWNTQSMMGMGGFRTVFSIPEEDSTVRIYIPEESGLITISESDRARLTGKLRDECGMEPASLMEQKSVLEMLSGCSCTQLKAVIENELSWCIGSEKVESSFWEDSSTCASGLCETWGCNKNEVISDIEGCGFNVRGCS